MKNREEYVAEVYRRYHACKKRQKRRQGYLILCLIPAIVCSVMLVLHFYPFKQHVSDFSVSSKNFSSTGQDASGHLTVQVTDASGRSWSTQETAIPEYLAKLTLTESLPNESQTLKGTDTKSVNNRPQFIISITNSSQVQTYHVQEGVLTIQESDREILLTQSQQEQLLALIQQLQPDYIK